MIMSKVILLEALIEIRDGGLNRASCQSIAMLAIDKETEAYKFDVTRSDLNHYTDSKLKTRTLKRLIEIAKLGMYECMTAEFGYEGVMTGLYIEHVWNYPDKKFDDYMDRVRAMIMKKG